MEFPGTISLSPDAAQRVYFQAAQSPIHHGFRRILFVNAHIGNQYLTAYVADRINQETPAIALELHTATQGGQAADPRTRPTAAPFDRHAGVGETRSALYLIPSLVDLSQA